MPSDPSFNISRRAEATSLKAVIAALDGHDRASELARDTFGTIKCLERYMRFVNRKAEGGTTAEKASEI